VVSSSSLRREAVKIFSASVTSGIRCSAVDLIEQLIAV